MDLAPDLTAALYELRTAAESLMVDSYTITRASGVVDPLTGQATRQAVYTGRCRVKAYLTQVRDVESAGRDVILTDGEVHLPVGSYVPRPDDLVTVTACDTDALAVGRVYRVGAPRFGSQITAYRLPVTIVEGD